MGRKEKNIKKIYYQFCVSEKLFWIKIHLQHALSNQNIWKLKLYRTNTIRLLPLFTYSCLSITLREIICRCVHTGAVKSVSLILLTETYVLRMIFECCFFWYLRSCFSTQEISYNQNPGRSYHFPFVKKDKRKSFNVYIRVYGWICRKQLCVLNCFASQRTMYNILFRLFFYEFLFKQIYSLGFYIVSILQNYTICFIHIIFRELGFKISYITNIPLMHLLHVNRYVMIRY